MSDAQELRIPKVIHYCWFGNNPLPEDAKRCIESWKEYCPDFEIKKWDESNFDINSIPYVQEAYAAKKWAFVTDYVRLWVIEKEGGVYLDTDVELIASLDQILEGVGCVVCEEVPGRINTGVGFAATPHHPVVKAMLDEYSEAHFLLGNGSYDLTACPIRNTRGLVKQFYDGHAGLIPQSDCRVLSSDFMSPINAETGECKITVNTVSIHHFSGSWKDDSEKELYAKKMKLQKNFGLVGTYIYYGYALFHEIKHRGLISAIKQAMQKISLRK
ncbi:MULTISPECIES: glycosyltransferase family 32 protein [Bifidobacterium]|uniref:glycosyltransferase family 32 protein n=1 Tax=Bifidobacterium TaxID=1678 RepID=UPI001BDD31C2|nr:MULTISPECIES: glycosyltransferase [Bifidobacterium]MBT1161017.1 glycosyl transferase [Bifidobacterium sp. SO1]MBW3079547.1 glycosyl transferase [Bifidobacterium simiiventris]